MQEEMTRKCPNCGARIPVLFGFRTWCDHCNWNLEDTPFIHTRGVFERTWLWLSQQRMGRPTPDLATIERVAPRYILSTALIYFLALLVHAFTLFLFYIGFQLVLMPVFFGQNQFLIVSLAQFAAGAVILLVGSRIFPRFPRLPATLVRRENAPGLFRLADRVAAALMVPPPQAINLSPEFAAGYEEMGLRGERVLRLGLPALMALDRQEFVALLAHALSHHRTGDPRRNWLVMSSIESLVEWHRIFHVDTDHFVPVPGLAGIINFLFQTVRFTLASVSWLGASAIAVLLYPILIRGEFLADYLSARVAGKDAAARLQEKIFLRGSYGNILVKSAHTPGIKVLREIRKRLSNVPEREMLRIRRIIANGQTRLGPAHPTTQQRLVFLQSLTDKVEDSQAGEVQITAIEHTRMMAELAPFEAEVEQQILQHAKEGYQAQVKRRPSE